MFKNFIMWLKNLFKRKPKSEHDNYFENLTRNRKVTDSLLEQFRAKIKIRVELGGVERKTAGGHHAWYNSNIGLIRKPIQ